MSLLIKGFILLYFQQQNQDKMGEIITLLIIMIATGTFIYITKYKNKEKPKVGIKREKPSEYFKDYLNLKLYWVSIAFIVIGCTILLAIIILEIVFS